MFAIPLFPLFVVTEMTPLPAREPYKAEAAAPFTTSIDSTSSTLISERLPCIMIPSIRISGEALTLRTLSPRSRRSICCPGLPPTEDDLKPATFPVKAEETEKGGTALS